MSRCRLRVRRRGATFLNTLVVSAIVVLGACFLLPAVHKARVDSHANACRENLGRIVRAAALYDARNGKYPGYMNLLITERGHPYRDPESGRMVPVSWAVELLNDLDRRKLYEDWRREMFMPAEDHTIEFNTPRNSEAPPKLDVYLDVLVCPGDFTRPTSGAPLSYIVNTGMPDLTRSRPAASGAAGGANASVGFPRDWQANGMSFDNYSDDKLVKRVPSERGPSIVMHSRGVRDPKAKTIFFSENLDAVSYLFDKHTVPSGDPALCEVAWGSVWASGKLEPAPNAAADMPKAIMTPRDDVSAPNALNDGRPHPFGYKYCRPSSPHPDGMNIAFVDGNVLFVNDSLSYFVFAKLSASDDMAIRIPGEQTLLRGPAASCCGLNGIGDCDINP